jgi:hypothetical protein
MDYIELDTLHQRFAIAFLAAGLKGDDLIAQLLPRLVRPHSDRGALLAVTLHASHGRKF